MSSEWSSSTLFSANLLSCLLRKYLFSTLLWSCLSPSVLSPLFLDGFFSPHGDRRRRHELQRHATVFEQWHRRLRSTVQPVSIVLAVDVRCMVIRFVYGKELDRPDPENGALSFFLACCHLLRWSTPIASGSGSSRNREAVFKWNSDEIHSAVEPSQTEGKGCLSSPFCLSLWNISGNILRREYHSSDGHCRL